MTNRHTHPQLSVILPTKNEEKNLVTFVTNLLETLEGIFDPGAYEIIIIDDSTDSTAEIASNLSTQTPCISVINREPHERTGLASALAHGFRVAQGHYICTLDCDNQHPPATIAALYREIKKSDNDIVIGSRYTQGGSAEGLHSGFRKFVSRLAKRISHGILPQTRVTTDPGSGMFIFKKSLVDDVALTPRGFKILIELLVKTHTERVSEIGYCFKERLGNESKASVGRGVDFIIQIISLYLQTWNSRRRSRSDNTMNVSHTHYNKHQKRAVY